jgi:isopentenyl phosphate kinase
MLVLLKLGGSLITNKDKPNTARLDIIKKAAEEISLALKEVPGLKLILGHGSGSFGHFASLESGFREGASTPDEWLGFQQVWMAAHNLNQIVMKELDRSGLPVISFPPSASILTNRNNIQEWNIQPIINALKNELIPVIFGDTVFDVSFGGVILSTEELFLYLINKLNPDRIILAGKEPGVWADFPINKNLIEKITSENYYMVRNKITSSQSVDVTGGMIKKVELMLGAVSMNPKLSVEIISGEKFGNINKSLKGNKIGTIIAAK